MNKRMPTLTLMALTPTLTLMALTLMALTPASGLSAQGIKRLFEDGAFSARIQAEAQYCFRDSAGDTSGYTGRFLSNTYVDGAYNSRMVSAGIRFEMFEAPLPGFEPALEGWGIPHLYLTLKTTKIAVTAGDFYEQLGSGVILRAYQERPLGIDNPIRGARVAYEPFPWMRLKALAGVQRDNWDWNNTWIKAADAEADIDQCLPAMARRSQQLQLGASFVSKHEPDQVILAGPGQRLNLPPNVGAFSARLKYRAKKLTIRAEYAWKANDPSADNGYIYRPGQALILSASYAQKQLGISLAAKHSDNMSMRTQRTAVGTTSQLNYLPAFSRQHTYSLAAIYPYATQANGEVAYQADLFYKFAKGTPIGGKYGTELRLNYAQAHSLKKTYATETGKPLPGTYGYTTALFRPGNELYHRDANIEISRKMNPDLKLALMYMNQAYNRISRGEAGMIYSHISAAEAEYRINPKTSLRCEVQYLATRQDEKDWAGATAELSVSPHWTFTLAHLYNIGGSPRQNYPLANVAYSIGAHRIQLTAGKQRAGYNCAGGICRYVPQTKGIALAYTSNF